ncbi:hypothetical protein B0H10DRAFT_2224465 [Mycena sp. CBHHK59/15]|nr:hypothetical protein B0H10DRAFT_2224465 [Mycena sp. CBHHK59/15]
MQRTASQEENDDDFPEIHEAVYNFSTDPSHQHLYLEQDPTDPVSVRFVTHTCSPPLPPLSALEVQKLWQPLLNEATYNMELTATGSKTLQKLTGLSENCPKKLASTHGERLLMGSISQQAELEPVVVSSKRPCACCSIVAREKHIAMPMSHGHVYPWSPPCDLESEIAKKVHSFLQKMLLDSLKEMLEKELYKASLDASRNSSPTSSLGPSAMAIPNVAPRRGAVRVVTDSSVPIVDFIAPIIVTKRL